MLINQQLDEATLSREEVAAIVKRAGELQRATGGAETESAALTLAEVRRSAEELGLSSALIEQAAREIRTKGIPQRRSIWGGPWVTDLSATVPADITEADYPDVVETLRDASGRLGETSNCGAALEWTSSSPDLLHATVRSVPEGTRVRVHATCGEWAAAFYVIGGLLFPFILTAAIGGSLHLTLQEGAPVAAAVFGGSFAMARAGFNHLCRSRRRTAEAVFAALQRRLSSSRPTGEKGGGAG